MATKTKSPPRARMLKGYDPDNFFDEMLAGGSVPPGAGNYKGTTERKLEVKVDIKRLE